MKCDEVCWALTTGEAGMRSQALGLAEAVGLPVVEKQVVARWPWSMLPTGLLPGGRLPPPLTAFDPAGGQLVPPWPRLVVSCGRRSVGAALAIKRASGGRTIAAHVQNPRSGTARFDLVVAMAHDGIAGGNVHIVRTALHRVTQQRLAAEREAWRPRLAPDNAPLLGVLVGGDNRGYRLSEAATQRLLGVLRSAKSRHGLIPAVTPSRRTGEAARKTLAEAIGRESLGRWLDATDPNPYFGILALAERLIVTSESVSLISEALATGLPVHVLPLEGHGRRHESFVSGLAADGLVSLIEGSDLDWSFAGQAPIDATAEPAARIREMLERPGRQPTARF